jgi:TPR repeat protein
MNVKIAHIAAIFTVLALAGCANNGPDGGHSEKWYEKHTADMRAEHKWCENQSLDTQMRSKSCTRARRALLSEMLAPKTSANARPKKLTESDVITEMTTYAKLGYAKAQAGLGAYLSSKKEYAKAVYWSDKAAEKGNILAELCLGHIYATGGNGVTKNYTKAFYWRNKAAAQGSAYAENKVGNAYYQGIGVPKSYAKAIYWWKKAAAHGGKLGRRDQKKIDRLEHS